MVVWDDDAAGKAALQLPSRNRLRWSIMRCCTCRRATLFMLSSLVTAFILLSNEDDEFFDEMNEEYGFQETDTPAEEISEPPAISEEAQYEDPPVASDGRNAPVDDSPQYKMHYQDEPVDSGKSERPVSPEEEDNFQAPAHAPRDFEPSNRGGVIVDSVAPAGSGSVQEEVDRIVDYLSTSKLKCHSERFVGSAGNSTGQYRDGAYHICNQEPYWILPEKRMTPCLGYSFGIDYEWSFDDGLARDFGCEVHSFDPGMYDEPMHFTRKDRIFFHRMGIDTSNSDAKYSRAMRDYSYRKKYGNDKLEELRKWKVRTLKQFMMDLGHRDKIIDIVKIDIEGPRQGYEVDVIRSFIQSGAHRCIRQLSFELHLFGPIGDPMYVRSAYSMIKSLEAEGYRLYGIKPSFAIDIDERRKKIPSEKTELLWCLGFVNTNVEKCSF